MATAPRASHHCHDQHTTAAAPAALQDMSTRVFGWLREEQVIDSQYLQAALAQYVSSCHGFGIAVPPSLALLYVEILLDQVCWRWLGGCLLAAGFQPSFVDPSPSGRSAGEASKKLSARRAGPQVLPARRSTQVAHPPAARLLALVSAPAPPPPPPPPAPAPVPSPAKPARRCKVARRRIAISRGSAC